MKKIIQTILFQKMEKIDEYLEKFGFNQLDKVAPLKQLADKLSIKVHFLFLRFYRQLTLDIGTIVLSFG